MTKLLQKRRSFWMLMALCLWFAGCATVQNLMNVQKPNVSVKNVRFTGMSLSDIDLAVELAVENPNQVAANLLGFDYDFQINQASFLTGQQDSPQEIGAAQTSSFEIPLTLNFKDLYSTFAALKNQDNSGYKIDVGVTVDLPLLGKTRIPVSHSGEVPMIKVPTVKVSSLKLDKLNLTGADLALNIEVDNPNGFAFSLKNMNYNFNVNGQNWAEGLSSQAMQIAGNGKGNLRVPISLNFLEVGQTVFNLLSGNNSVNYNFDGTFGFDTSLPLLKNIDLPVNRSGNLEITR